MNAEELVSMATASRRTSWTATELLATEFDPPRFAVDGIFPEGLSFMAGAPKLGKSWMALGLSIEVASGGHALGKIPVEPGEVLYLALEDSPRRLRSRLMTMLDGEGAPDGLYVETAWNRLDDGGLDRLEVWLDEHPSARLVLIDVWPRIRARADKRTDHYQIDYDAAAMLQEVAIRRGIAIVALYHTRKAEALDFVETVQGTFGTAAAADTIVVVKRSRGEADATLHVTGRDVQEQELALNWDALCGAWTLLGDAAVFAIGETRRELIEAVMAHGELTPKQASEVTEVGYELAKKTLKRMADDGQLQASKGRYTLPSPVPGVPMSLDGGTKGQGGHPLRGGDM